MTQITSPAKALIREDYIKWMRNGLKFVAPTLAIFFAQLAIGVELKAASLVALLAFYQTLADLFSKWDSKTTYVEKE